MKNMEFQSFKEFELWLEEVQTDLKEKKKNNPFLYSDLLFRGHADESWPLLTTLERECPSVTSISDYLRSAARIKLEVELHTGKKWDPILDKKGEIIQDYERQGIQRVVPSLEYLVYLRHHGFPSPLLDWTRSPYIAALFAYSGNNDKNVDRIAIFVHQLCAGGSVLPSNFDDGLINSIGPYIDTHKRHSIQQAQYTLCLKSPNLYMGPDQIIQSHEEYRKTNPQQLYKVTIPKSERNHVLSKLDKFNLNLHALYGSEESLMTTLALREFHLK